MSLKSRLTSVGVFSIVAAVAIAQPPQPEKKGAAPAGGAVPAQPKGEQPGGGHDDMAMMAEMAKPVEQHARLKEMAGTWDAELKLWMDPTATEPMTSKGTMVNTMTHGDRFVHHEYKGEFMGMPFTGSGDWGYNKVTGKYEGTWMDNAGTGMLFMTGTYDEKSKTYHCTGTFEMPGPDGKPMKITQREEIRIISADKHTMTMYHSAAAMPKEMKVIEITYTRAGKGAAAPAAEKPKAPAAPSAK